MATMTYIPPGSVEPYLTGDKFVNLIVGPVGSTKTTASLVKIAYEAKRMAAGKDGIRRSRCVVVRNTNQMLQDTTIPDFLKWYPDGIAGVYEKTNKKFLLKFDDVECEVLFRGLDDPNDVRRLLSLQLSFGVMDEFREIHKDIYEALQGRVGRYPDGLLVPHREEWGLDDKGHLVQGCVDDNGQPLKKIWGATNPPDSDTYWEELLTSPPSNVNVVFQPSGLSPEADWIQHLPSNYYENLAEGKSDDWKDVYIHGKFGRSLSGKPVWRAFNRDVHVASKELKPVKAMASPVVIGFDCTGLNPAVTIGQLGFENRLYVYDGLAAVDMGVVRFVREVLKPLLVKKYDGCRVVVVIDPAGMARDNEERTVKDILEVEGFQVVPARTNNITARIAAVEDFLTRMVDGKAAITVCPSAKDLIATMQGKYRFKMKNSGEIEDKPEKSHPWADIADSLQYLALHADGGNLFGRTVASDQKREVVRVRKRNSY